MSDFPTKGRADNLPTAILSLRFSTQVRKMRQTTGWSPSKLKFVETQYRRYLFLWATYPTTDIPPTEEVDEFWHAHILDTKKYSRDCQKVFGRYKHHYPYFGIRSAEDKRNLLDAFIKARRLYRKHFGEDIYSYG